MQTNIFRVIFTIAVTILVVGYFPSLSEGNESVVPSQVEQPTLSEGRPTIHLTEQEQVVRDFYKALSNNNCDKAVELRPGYKCRGGLEVKVGKVVHHGLDDENSVIYLEVSWKEHNKLEIFKGYTSVKRVDKKWIIMTRSFRKGPGTGPGLKQYLREQELNDPKVEEVNHAPVYSSNGVEPASELGQYSHEQSLEPRVNKVDRTPAYSPLGSQTFGSQKILESCWTQPQLKGSPTDRKIQSHVSSPQDNPPVEMALNQSMVTTQNGLNRSIRYTIPRNSTKLVALTFDLCERFNEITGYDAEIVNYLRENQIKATFYAGGKWMQSHPEKTMQLMADPLFEIGSHAWTHGNFRLLTDQEMEEQISWTTAQYKELRYQLQQSCTAFPAEMQKIPLSPSTFRFPYGTCNQKSLQKVASHGLYAVQWNIVTGDPAPRQTAKSIAKTILNQIQPGSIIVAHANGRGHGTAQALPLFIPELQKQGYIFVTVSELLAPQNAERIISEDTCYETKPGDNVKYDKLFGKGNE